MILVWSLGSDGPTRRLREQLHDLGGDVVFVDQRRVLEHNLEVEVGDTVTGYLDADGHHVDLTEVVGVFPRPYDFRRIGRIASAEPYEAEWNHAAAFDETMWLYCELTDALVVNPPDVMAGNGSKPRQAADIERHGLRVPATLLTTSAEAAREFADSHGRVVYKSTSSVRSVVSTLDDLGRLDGALSSCPTQFQEFVPGTDYRVHVVGDRFYCSSIESLADDYRYGAIQGMPPTLLPASVPDEIAENCRALAADLGLVLAGIDLRRTPDGTWFCFEVNPSPAFTFYDRHGQGIARAVARLLLEGRPT